MMVLQVIPDRFAAQQAKEAASRKDPAQEGKNHVRRPTRGIQLKEETFATLRVVAGSGKPVRLIDAGSRREGAGYENDAGQRTTDVYSNFLLQSLQEERQEKQQILETFGEAYIFLFGERARIMTFSGVLLNTFDFNWEAEWWENYERYLRGTRCVENDARVFITFDQTVVSGYILGCGSGKNTGEPHHVPFQFTLFITGYTNFSELGSPDAFTGGYLPPSGNHLLSAEEEAALRPPKWDSSSLNNARAMGQLSIESAKARQKSLSEALAQHYLGPTMKSISRASRWATRAIESSAADVTAAANGQVIRVPLGFEGSLIFDDGDNTTFKEVSSAGTVRYTTFSDNEDEYVGSGQHYQSALRGTAYGGGALYDARNDPAYLNRSITQTVEQARKTWSEAGLEMPATQSGTLSRLLGGGVYGLLSAGSTTAWRAAKKVL